MLKYIFVLIMLFVLESIYLKIAKKKNIKDKPNHRSAHTIPVIRGGGIVIIISILIYAVFYEFNTVFYYFLCAVLLVSIVSFIDDLITLSSKIRIAVHLIAFTILFIGLDLMQVDSFTSVVILLVVGVFSVGFLNIYNFMDGINGLTFLNTLVTYAALLFLNENYIVFTDSNLLIVLILSILVFGFFNFRRLPLCFAGDIGSIAIGFSMIYFAIQLCMASGQPIFLLLFSVYLLDGGWTIFERILRREAIIEAHRRHLYQILANDLKYSHLKISTGYFMVQLAVNIIVIFTLEMKIETYFLTFLIFTFLSFGYWILKRVVWNKLSSNI